MKDSPLIELKAVKKVFYTDEMETWALNNINLAINDGEFVSISGPSGCGKSTLLTVMGLLNSFNEGQYFLNGSDVSQLGEKSLAHLRNKEIGFIFQAFNLIADMTVFENVELPLTFRNDLSAKQRGEMVTAALAQVQMDHRQKHYPAELSGGQQQRVAIARAFAAEPDLIVCDEITSALDVSVQAQVLDLLLELQRSTGTAYLFISHDLGVIRRMADRVVVLRHGEVCEAGPTDEVFRASRSPYTRLLLEASALHAVQAHPEAVCA